MPESVKTTAPSRLKIAFVIVLILLPLVLMAIVKYAPALTGVPKISAVSIVPPRVRGPEEYDYLADDIVRRLREGLSDLRGVSLTSSPSAAEVEQSAQDVAKLASGVGADALVLTSVTVDAGIVQLGLQLIDPATHRVLYDKPYQSSIDRYPDMMRAAAASLRRVLEASIISQQ